VRSANTVDAVTKELRTRAFELLPGIADVEVRCAGGRVTLAGSVHHKRLKRDVGEIAWAIPVLHDVQNNVTITSRRRARSTSSRDTEVPATPVNRKQG
jgi:osmotically-inducible protein OsmY